MKSVKVSYPTLASLKVLKDRYGKKSIDEVINYLLQIERQKLYEEYKRQGVLSNG